MDEEPRQAGVAPWLRFLEEGYRRKSWHGPNLRNSLRGLTPTQAAWRGDLALLDDMHQRLRDAVSQLAPRALRRIPQGSTLRIDALILGVAAHDIYHAGQIQLLKRLLPPSA